MNSDRKTWKDYLDEGYTVVLDNDSWWFVDYNQADGEMVNPTADGGDGPYGRDLLEYLLNKHYSGMEYV